MNKEELSDLLKKQKFSENDINELNRMVEKYPYFSTARTMLLQAKKNNDELTKNEIYKHAFFLHNRSYAYDILHSDVVNRMKDTFKDKYHSEVINNHTEDSSLHKTDKASDEFTIESGEKEDQLKTENDLLDFSYTHGQKTESSIEDNDQDSDSEEKTEIITQKKDTGEEKHEGFISWINEIQDEKEQKEEDKANTEVDEGSSDLIERFIHGEYGPIRADKKTQITGDISRNSIEESEELITDTLAKVYVKQGLYSKAIYAYEKLSLKYPEKSVYFASQIEEIKKLK